MKLSGKVSLYNVLYPIALEMHDMIQVDQAFIHDRRCHCPRKRGKKEENI